MLDRIKDKTFDQSLEKDPYKLFAGLMLLSVKYLSDDHPGNETMAAIAGVKKKELNEIERMIFVNALDSSMYVSPEKFQEKQTQIFGEVKYRGDFTTILATASDETTSGNSAATANSNAATASGNAAATASVNAAATASSNSEKINNKKKKPSAFSFISSCMPSFFGRKKEGLASLVQATDEEESGSPKKMAGQKSVEVDKQDPKKPRSDTPGRGYQKKL